MSKMPVQLRAIVFREKLRGVIAWSCVGLIAGAIVGVVLMWTMPERSAMASYSPVVGMAGAIVGAILRLIWLRVDPMNERLLVGRLDERLGTREALSSILDPVSGDDPFVHAARKASLEAWQQLEPRRMVAISPHRRLVHACSASCLMLAASWVWQFDRRVADVRESDAIASSADDRVTRESSVDEKSDSEKADGSGELRDHRTGSRGARFSEAEGERLQASSMTTAETDHRDVAAAGDEAESRVRVDDSGGGVESANSIGSSAIAATTTTDKVVIKSDRAIVDASDASDESQSDPIASRADSTSDRSNRSASSSEVVSLREGDQDGDESPRGTVSAMNASGAGDEASVLGVSRVDQAWEAARTRARLEILSGRVPGSAARLVRAYFDRVDVASEASFDERAQSKFDEASDGVE